MSKLWVPRIEVPDLGTVEAIGRRRNGEPIWPIAGLAAPSWVGAGSITSSTTTITWASDVATSTTDDIEVIIIESANEAISASGTGWAEIGTQVGVGAAAGLASTRLAAYWRRYNGHSDLNISDAGNHVVANKFLFRGCETSGDPFEAAVRTTSSTTEVTSLSGTGLTTLGADRLYAAFIVAGKPDSLSTAQLSASAITNATSVTERFDGAHTGGNGGWIGVVTGVAASSGSYGPFTGTYGTASVYEILELAFKPPSGGGGPTPQAFAVAGGI